MIENQVVDFLIEKGYKPFKIDEIFIYDNYPEDYKFLEGKDGEWEYGSVSRDDRKVLKVFNEKEEALMYFIMKTYRVRINIEFQEKVFDKFDNLPKEDQLKFIINISKEENLDLEELKLINENQLCYNDSIIIDNKYYKVYGIEEFYLLKLYELKTIKAIQKELLAFGLNKEIVYKYFNFENLVEE